MPLIRCSKCGQAYDVPGVVAVKLTNAIATCHCGEWLSGSKAAVLARMLNPSDIKEVDLQPYRVSTESAAASPASEQPAPFLEPTTERSIRILARGGALNTIFTISDHPLIIGSRACHVEIPEAELSLRHCSIFVRGRDLVVRDEDSHMGTFLDGAQIREAEITDGVHLLRVGSALITIEPTSEPGVPVEPMRVATEEIVNDERLLKTLARAHSEESMVEKRAILVCIEGMLAGQEFEIPPTGLVVGREGHVRVPDEFLSRKHFEVLRHDDGFVRVKDLGSRNGTFLNSLPAQETKVHPGDEIRAGTNRFKIEYRD